MRGLRAEGPEERAETPALSPGWIASSGDGRRWETFASTVISALGKKRSRRAGATVAAAVIGVSLVVVVAALTRGSLLTVLSISLEFGIVVMSSVLLYGECGLLSLGQGAFMSVGAYAVGILSSRYGLPTLLAVLVGVVIGAALGGLVAVPFRKLRGLYLAMGFFALTVIVSDVATGLQGVTGGAQGVVVPNLEVAGFSFNTGREQFLLAGGCLIAVGMVLAWVRRTRVGHAVRMIGVAEAAAASVGVPVDRYKVAVVSVASGIAALGGALYAMTLSFVAPDSPGVQSSLSVVVMQFIGGAYSYLGAVAGAVIYNVIPYSIQVVTKYELIFIGLVLIVVLRFNGRGLSAGIFQEAGKLRRVFKHEGSWLTRSSSVKSEQLNQDRSAAIRVVSECAVNAKSCDEPTIEVRAVSKSYGGIKVLSEVNFAVEGRGIVSLVGPNGAGKTTLVNLISGFDRPDGGTIKVNGTDTGRLGAPGVAKVGLRRTFQHPRLMDDASVIENIYSGAFFRQQGRHTWIARGPLGQGASVYNVQKTVEQIINALELEWARNQRVDTLPFGLRHRTQIGRALAGLPNVLLLDEPCAGLDDIERTELADVLASFAGNGLRIILVEHNMDVVMRISERVLVLDSGRLIADGTPDEVRLSQTVRKAYLGSEPIGG